MNPGNRYVVGRAADSVIAAIWPFSTTTSAAYVRRPKISTTLPTILKLLADMNQFPIAFDDSKLQYILSSSASI